MQIWKIIVLCLLSVPVFAGEKKKGDQDTTKVKSVVIRKDRSQDTLTRPIVKPRKWRPRVVIVPATSPGGRSRQEIQYSDSAGKR